MIIGCCSLKRIELPSTLNSIDPNAFYLGDMGAVDEIVINKPKDSISGSPWGCPSGNKAIIWTG